MKALEFKINIDDTQEKHVEGLILGLVYSGYEAYFSYNKAHICFTGHPSDIITQKVEVVE